MKRLYCILYRDVSQGLFTAESIEEQCLQGKPIRLEGFWPMSLNAMTSNIIVTSIPFLF